MFWRAATNNIVLKYGVEGEFITSSGEQHLQKTLPVKVTFDNFPDDSFYGKIVMTRGTDNIIYHRHITKMKQDFITEDFIERFNLDYDLQFPVLGSNSNIQEDYMEVLSNIENNEAGDGSFIVIDECKLNILVIRDRKNKMTLRIPVKI